MFRDPLGMGQLRMARHLNMDPNMFSCFVAPLRLQSSLSMLGFSEAEDLFGIALNYHHDKYEVLYKTDPWLKQL